MTDEEFDAFVSAATSELEAKQDVLTAKYGFGSYARFLFDQPTATLQFFDEAGTSRLRATAIPLGSYAPESGTWKWAWANESILEPLRSQASKLKDLYELTGMDVFNNPAFEGPAEMAWQAVSMAVKHLGALGCYKAPSHGSDLYLAILKIALPENGEPSNIG